MHVTVIAKAPVPGRVKTRLCPPCSPQQAAALAAAGLAETMSGIDATLHARSAKRRTGVMRTLLLDGTPQPWMSSAWRVIAQRGEGLADRLANGFSDLGPGVIIGMETPHITPLLGRALDAVSAGNDVFGPAEDGGYWMIGLCARTAARALEVFDGVVMSTSTTGAVQLERLKRIGQSPVVFPVARDLDDFDDLLAIAESSREGELATLARATVDALQAHADHPDGRQQPSLPVML